MIKMALIFMKDTGFIKPGSESGTAFSGSSIVNAGTEVPIKVDRIDYQRGTGLDDKPQPAAFTERNLNFVSITNPIIILQGIIKGTGDLTDGTSNKINIYGGVSSYTDADGSPSTNELGFLELLDRMCKTKGYKNLYYKSSSNALTQNNLIYALGDTDSEESTYRHLHVRCKGINITQTAKGLITWRLTCVVEAAP